MTKSKPTLLSRFQGCLMGARLGARCTTDFKSKAADDRWWLTEAVAESLIRRRGLNREELKSWLESNGGEGRAASALSVNSARGNGVAMKIAPLALFHQHGRERYLEVDVSNLGRMTHSDPLAWITAYALARIIQDMTLHGDCNITGLVSQIRQTERRHAGARLVKDAFSSRLDDMTSPYLCSASIEDVLLITGRGFDCVESVSVAIACALRHLDDPRAGLHEAVYCGGDTGANASMAGAILGARSGIEGWPEEWRGFLPDYYATLDLGARLLGAAQEEDGRLSRLRKIR